MTPEEFQKWLGDSKIETTIKYLSKANGLYNPKKAWEYIKVGHEYRQKKIDEGLKLFAEHFQDLWI